ncbi:hypothetical protein FRACYDRAFT_249464 [Fragilariopsis cylindrus CCMP1102]|uniref:Cysteine/serine-rich nuclear protein N-terminal domain-containing protein n=1 Tax=Fragilariopsis cylindrus CCMP1102 TaxID=635003 RepID=A0A1E7ERN4_9STRA|nr:hypothetical protein FRACYDRAFT_249464 [Fragilariopsis cylindrus CCMP1102]|eukprot:OEU08572.1 hypothetical protein FRACYDRAFT_249464 [Fragilariopsis cylindrus CCMP1102]
MMSSTSSRSSNRSSSSIVAVDDNKDRVQKFVVSFSTLTVREYPRCIGYDTVTSVGGPPISMERYHQNEISYTSVDEYEEAIHISMSKKSRSLLELKLPSKQRDDILRQHGYSLAERQNATKQSTITRNQRKKCNKGQGRSNNRSFFNSIKKSLFSNKKVVSPA